MRIVPAQTSSAPRLSVKPAVLLIAHGSRREEANRDLVKLTALVKQRLPGKIVEFAYLELTEPTIPQGAEACVQQGATSVTMLPYFLSAGAHVVEDLEAFRVQFASRFPAVTFLVSPPLGLHPMMLEILFQRLEEAK